MRRSDHRYSCRASLQCHFGRQAMDIRCQLNLKCNPTRQKLLLLTIWLIVTIFKHFRVSGRQELSRFVVSVSRAVAVLIVKGLANGWKMRKQPGGGKILLKNTFGGQFNDIGWKIAVRCDCGIPNNWPARRRKFVGDLNIPGSFGSCFSAMGNSYLMAEPHGAQNVEGFTQLRAKLSNGPTPKFNQTTTFLKLNKNNTIKLM